MSEIDLHIQAILVKSYDKHTPEHVTERRHVLTKRLLFGLDMHEHNPSVSWTLEDNERDLKNTLVLNDESE